MNILINDYTNIGLIEKYYDLIYKAIFKCLQKENFTTDIEISFCFVDNDIIKEYNKKFRNIDKITDVLSFPMIDFKIEEKENYKKKSYMEKNRDILLGDIVISYEKAVEQAKEFGHSIERELSFLVVHSVLHLLGYDHNFEDEEKIMFEKQESIMTELNLLR